MSGTADHFNGHIDEFRISHVQALGSSLTVGIARCLHHDYMCLRPNAVAALQPELFPSPLSHHEADDHSGACLDPAIENGSRFGVSD